MDETRFRALFDKTYPVLARYAYHRGLDRDDAEDLIASTYEVAWRRADQFPVDDDEALPWLYAVAFNQLRNLRRKGHRDVALTARLPKPEHAPAPPEPDDLALAAIRRALDGLRDDDREVIVLVAWDGLSAAQAGAVLGCGPVAVRARLHRARKRLAVLLDRERKVSHLRPTRHEQDENFSSVEAST